MIIYCYEYIIFIFDFLFIHKKMNYIVDCHIYFFGKKIDEKSLYARKLKVKMRRNP